jgi:glutaredoxin
MITIYGKENCKYCDAAKTLLNSRNIKYVYKSLPEDISLEEFKELFPGRKTVPQIIFNGKLLDDGYTSLRNMMDSYDFLEGGYGDDFA